MDGVVDLVQSVAEMTDEELYERDFPAWCLRQAGRMRRLAASAMGEDQPDWPRIIEEVEDMGASQRRQVESLLVQAMVHLIKLQGAQNGSDAAHWIAETRAFLDDAARSFAPSMRRAIDMDDLHRSVWFRLTGNRSAPACPFTLDELISPLTDVAVLMAKLP
jgi:hypothetical protein